MSEQTPVRNERLLQAHNTGETNEIPHVESSAETSPLKVMGHEALAEATRNEALDAARRIAQEQAISSAEATSTQVEAHNPADDSHSFAVHRQLKANAFSQSLRTIQRRLPKHEQAFSKLIHSPKVEAVSEVAGNTVARPSGILGGALCALIGSATLVFMTRHYGFAYNYTMFLIFFVGGFGIGLLLEMLIRLLYHRNK